MTVKSYNDYLRHLLSDVDCVLAFDTAADFLGLTNGGYRTVVQIFVDKKQDIEGTEQTIVPSLADLECEEYSGLICTTINRTIIDLLEQNGDEQIITESLANYYEDHNESFDGLRIPEHLQIRFKKYTFINIVFILYKVFENVSNLIISVCKVFIYFFKRISYNK